MTATIESVEEIGNRSAQFTTVQTFQREGSAKPICVARATGFTAKPAG